MKNYLLILFLMGIYLVSGAQENTTISFSQVVFDFGNVKEQKGPVTHTFNFKNSGKKPFVISKVEASCGCTSPAYSKDPVKPGDSGYVIVTFNPAGKSGTFSSLITVTGNLGNGASLLTIKGWVVPRPRTVNDDYEHVIGNLRLVNKRIALGEIYSTSIDTGTIRFYNASNKIMTIKYLGGPAWIKYSKLPIILPPKQQGEIKIYYNAFEKNELGFIRDEIKLYTDDELIPEKEIDIFATIKVNLGKMSPVEKANAAKIKFDTTEHDFGKLKQGETGTCEFKFTNTGKSTLVIYTLKTSCGCTATTLGNDKLAPGDSSIINVSYLTKFKNGRDQTSVTVYTNDPDNETVILTIKANVVVTSK